LEEYVVHFFLDNIGGQTPLPCGRECNLPKKKQPYT
jgi:hypothetical protein